MKIKTTQKAIRQTHTKVICIGYCDAYHILQGVSPTYYTTRVEGWASDVYSIGSVAISTGYAPFGSYNVDYKTMRTLEDKARKMWAGKWSHARKVAHANKLLTKLIDSAE